MNIIDFKNTCISKINEESAKLGARILNGKFRKDSLDENYHIGVVNGLAEAARLIGEMFSASQGRSLNRFDGEGNS